MAGQDITSTASSGVNSSTSVSNSSSASQSTTAKDNDQYGHYLGQYENYLGFHTDNYKNILDSYLGTSTTPGILNKIGDISQQIKGGYDSLGQQTRGAYGDLSSQVLGGLRGVGESNRQDIVSAAAAQRGSADQNLVSAGLGNTTVRQNAQRGINLDEQKALTSNNNQTAQLLANYQSQIGQQGLGQVSQIGQGGLAQQQQAMNVIGSLGGQ